MASSCARSHDLIITQVRIRSMKRGVDEAIRHNDKNCGEPADDARASSTSLSVSESNSSTEARSVMCDKQCTMEFYEKGHQLSCS